MIAVAGHWEIGYSTPIQEANYWNLVLRDFGVSEWAMWPVSGVRHNEQHKVRLREFHDLPAILDHYAHLPRVYLEPRRSFGSDETTWLHDFKHPEDCLYIFGSAHFNPTIGHVQDRDSVVSIATVDNAGVPWAFQCLMVVLYDRLVKSWQ